MGWWIVVEAVLIAALVTGALYLLSITQSLWLFLFFLLFASVIAYRMWADPRRRLWRVGSLLIAASLIPSGGRFAAWAGVSGVPVNVSLFYERIGIPEWLPLLAGVGLVVLDAVFLRRDEAAAPSPDQFNHSDTVRLLAVKDAGPDPGVFMAKGELSIARASRSAATFQDATIIEPGWLMPLRRVELVPGGVLIEDDIGAWQQWTPGKPVKLGPGRNVTLMLQLRFTDRPLLTWLRRYLPNPPYRWLRVAPTTVQFRIDDTVVPVKVLARFPVA